MKKHVQGRVQITRECNQECVFCAAPPARDDQDLEETKLKIKELKKQGTTEVMLTGGEPLKSKHLFELIEYCSKLGFDEIAIQTNASLLTYDILKRMKKYPNIKLTVSIHTHKKDVFGKLSGHIENYDKAYAALQFIDDLEMFCYPTTVINSLNYKHLKEHVANLSRFKFVKHICFNYIDPVQTAKENKWVIPRYFETEKYIHEAVALLKSKGITFRIERLPLCYMWGFEEFSSDIRRGVFDQKRYTSFFKSADNASKEMFTSELNSKYHYAEQCNICQIKSLCPGINPQYVSVYGDKEVFPVFIDPKKIVEKVKRSR